MNCFKAYSTLTLPVIPQPQVHVPIMPILTYSMTLDRNGLQKSKRKRLYVRKLEIGPEKNYYETIKSKTRRQLKNMKTLTHLRAESPPQKLLKIFYPLSGLLANIKKFKTDIHKGEYDLTAFIRLINRMKRLSNFEDVNQYELTKCIKSPRAYYGTNTWYVVNNDDMTKIHKSRLYIYKKIIVRNLSVAIGTTIEDFLNISPVLQKFIDRTHSNINIYPRNYSTDQYLMLLSLIEQNYKLSESSMHLASVSYDFHQRHLEIQERIVSHITSTWTSLREITLSFEINSTNWFVEKRVENWKMVADTIVTKLYRPQPFKIIYNIIFNNEVNENTLQDMIVKAASLIQLCSQNQAKNYTEINVTIDCPKTLYGFKDFVEQVLKTMGNINKIKCESKHFLNDCDQRQALSAFEVITGMKKIPTSGNALCEFISLM